MLDSVVSIISGLAVGAIIYAANVILLEIADIHESLLSAVVIAAATYTLAPNHSCFTGHVLASLIWVFYGVSFTIALYEITVGSGALLLTGTARFVVSILSSSPWGLSLACGSPDSMLDPTALRTYSIKIVLISRASSPTLGSLYFIPFLASASLASCESPHDTGRYAFSCSWWV